MIPSRDMSGSCSDIKRGDVWLAKSNGKGQRAITRNGTPGNPYATTVWHTSARGGRFAGTTDGGQSVTWVTNDRMIVFAPNVFLAADAWLVSLGSPSLPTQWFQDRVDAVGVTDGEPLDDGELTRAQDKLALVRGPNTTASTAPTMVRVYSVAGLSERRSQPDWGAAGVR